MEKKTSETFTDKFHFQTSPTYVLVYDSIVHRAEDTWCLGRTSCTLFSPLQTLWSSVVPVTKFEDDKYTSTFTIYEPQQQEMTFCSFAFCEQKKKEL